MQIVQNEKIIFTVCCIPFQPYQCYQSASQKRYIYEKKGLRALLRSHNRTCDIQNSVSEYQLKFDFRHYFAYNIYSPFKILT
jgi:hypothetical protein